MTDEERQEWLEKHLPYRVRVLIACSSMLNEQIWELFPGCRRDHTTHYWKSADEMTERDGLVRRCETDAIWEGRLATLRWFVEFIGAYRPGSWREGQDIGIELLKDSAKYCGSDSEFLRQIWDGCSKRVVHPGASVSNTNRLTDEDRTIASRIILDHVHATLFEGEADWLKKCVQDAYRRG